MPPPPLRPWTLVCLLLPIALAAGSAAAESLILLPTPKTFGVFPAVSYDENGDAVGSSELAVERRDDGLVVIRLKSGFKEGARMRAEAELEPVNGSLRLVRELSQSHDPDGNSLGIMRIDHRRGEASCSPPEGSPDAVERLALPREDRVANVPLNLLFLPLVSGEQSRVHFQLVLCRGGPRVLDFAAWAVRSGDAAKDRIVEIRYRPDLGSFASWFASVVTPNLSFWYDSRGEGSYLAHRMPLYSKGPEVLVVRSGITPDLLPSLP